MSRRGSAWWVSLELVLRAVLALQALVATQRLWMVTSSVARRARLIAAARRLKSAFTFARPRTRARLPLCRRRIKWPIFRSIFGRVAV